MHIAGKSLGGTVNVNDGGGKRPTTVANEARYHPEYNYIYISHLDLEDKLKYFIFPSTPNTITDSMASTFQETNALGRSAPVLTYSNSGPRTVTVEFTFRIDALEEENAHNTSLDLAPGEYVCDSLIRALQSISLPKYDVSNKAVEPPMIALRLANEVFIKGVVNSAIGVTYELPIIYGNRYSIVRISFTVTEVDPYDAQTVYEQGSFRGRVKTLELPS